MSSFKAFQTKFNTISKVSKNYEILWEKLKCILLKCPLDYVAHYWKAMLEGMFYVAEVVERTLKEVPLVLRPTPLESVQLSEMKLFLSKIDKEMKTIVGKTGKVMFYRSKKLSDGGMFDIKYNSCVFKLDSHMSQIIIVTTDNKILLNLPVDKSFPLRSWRNMSDSINSLLVPVPPDAPADYDHSAYLPAPKDEGYEEDEDEDEEKVVASSATKKHTQSAINIKDDVAAISKANGFGSRKTPASSAKAKQKQAIATKYQDVSPTKVSSEAGGRDRGAGEKLLFQSPESAASEGRSPRDDCSGMNTTTESILTSENCEQLTPIRCAMTASSSAAPTPVQDQDCLDRHVNTSRSTPEQDDFPEAAAAVQVNVEVEMPKSESEVVTARKPYNFDDESQNIQPKFSSSFLSRDSDSEDSSSVKDRDTAGHPSSRDAIRRRFSANCADQDISSDEESAFDANNASDDDDFFVPDGSHEGIHPASAFKKAVQREKVKPTLKHCGRAEEEFNSSSDEETKKYKVQKAKPDGTSGPRNRPTTQNSLQKSSSRKRKERDGGGATSSSRKLIVTAVNHKPPAAAFDTEGDAPTFTKVLKSVVIKKRTRDEYKSNPLEDLSVHVTNEVRTSPPPPAITPMDVVISTPESIGALRAQNKTIDRNFVLFLVKNCTTRISADIALERCILDYLCKKQSINNLAPSEQQRIDNLEEIFLKIELLISNEIKAEHDHNHNVLDRAHQRTQKSIVHKCMMRQSWSQQSDASEEQKVQEENDIKLKEKALLAKLHAIATQAKEFNAQTCRYSLRKINTTLHYVCGKFCVIWLEANNCIGDLNPDVLRHYSNRAVTDATFATQLANATKNGIFLLDCDLELADGVETRGTVEQQKEEEDELRRILDGDHVQHVVHTIKSIAEDEKRIKELIKIVWTKETRVKLSHTIAKAKKVSDNSPVVTTATIRASVSSANDGSKSFTPTATSIVGQIPIATSVQLEPLQSLENAAVGSHKITNFFGSTSQPIAAPSTAGHLYKNKFEADPKSSLSKIARTFDKAFLLLTGRIRAVSATQCLEVTIKSTAFDSMLPRLKLFQFLFEHKMAKSSPAMVMMLLKNTELYELFDCFFLLKTSSLDGSNTVADGYCFTRCEHQLHHRVENDFKSTVAEMKALDKTCNSADSLTNANNAFRTFISELPSLMKMESRENDALVRVMSELVHFKRKKQLEIMPALLAVRPPGQPLAALFWGDIQTVTMLGFNVSAFSALVDEEFKLLVPKSRKSWIKYEASSVPKPRSSASVRLSKRPLSEIDQVLAEDLNIMVYASSHYFVCDNPGPVNSVISVFDELKASLVVELYERLALVEEVTPDALQPIDNIISSCENKSDNTDFGYFDYATFEHAFAKKFPDAFTDTVLVDLSDEPEDGETNSEVFKLKNALELSNAKLRIVDGYGSVLRKDCETFLANKK